MFFVQRVASLLTMMYNEKEELTLWEIWFPSKKQAEVTADESDDEDETARFVSNEKLEADDVTVSTEPVSRDEVQVASA